MAVGAAVLAIPAVILISIAMVASGFSGLLRLAFGALRAGVIPERRYLHDREIDLFSAFRGIAGVLLLTTAELMRSRSLPTRLPAPIPGEGLPSWIGILAHGTLWAVSTLAAVALLIGVGSLVTYSRQVRYPPPVTPEDGRARSVISPFLPLRAPATLAVVSLLTVAYAVVLPPLIPESGGELAVAEPPGIGSLVLLTALLILGVIGAMLLVGVVVVGLPLAVTFHSRGADGHPALPALWSLALAGLYLWQRGPEWYDAGAAWFGAGAAGADSHLVSAAMPGLTGTGIVIAISVRELVRLHVVHGIDPWTPTAVLTANARRSDNTLVVAEPQALVADLLPDNPQKFGAAWFSDYLRRKLWQARRTVQEAVRG
ncbi:hypothetical protein [Myceligenerans crystallogenes]